MKKIKLHRTVALLVLGGGLGLISGVSNAWASGVTVSRGQTVYVPTYSYVHVGEKGHELEIGVTLCIRNTDAVHSIDVMSVVYYDSGGKVLKSYATKPLHIGPMASVDFYVKPSDFTGGLAPSFIVKWESKEPVNEPIIENVMVGTRSGQGVSFVSVGKVISNTVE